MRDPISPLSLFNSIPFTFVFKTRNGYDKKQQLFVTVKFSLWIKPAQLVEPIFSSPASLTGVPPATSA